jgi:hypothetical protein
MLNQTNPKRQVAFQKSDRRNVKLEAQKWQWRWRTNSKYMRDGPCLQRVCIYTYIYIYTYIFIYIHIYSYIYIYEYICIYILVYVDIYSCISIYILLYMYICVYIYSCICTCVYIYIYTHTQSIEAFWNTLEHSWSSSWSLCYILNVFSGWCLFLINPTVRDLSK